MAYWRTVLRGQLGGVEDWSTSTNWGVVGLAPDVPDQAAADGILAKLLLYTTATNLPASLKSLLSTAATITGWRVEYRSEAETILSVAEGTLAGAVPGSATATKSPQDALAFSLRSNTPGARGRGRMYWPALGATLTNQFVLSTPTTTQAVTDMKTWLLAIGTQMNAYYIGIADARRVALSVRSVTDHVNRDIVQLQVGSIMDTQRRRRDTLLETYASVAYP